MCRRCYVDATLVGDVTYPSRLHCTQLPILQSSICDMYHKYDRQPLWLTGFGWYRSVPPVSNCSSVAGPQGRTISQYDRNNPSNDEARLNCSGFFTYRDTCKSLDHCLHLLVCVEELWK
jgi:hypothetical protein